MNLDTGKKILVVTDNGVLYSRIKRILETEMPDISNLFVFKRSALSTHKHHLYADGIENLQEVNLKKEYPEVISNYKLIISLHCKQLFPAELVNKVMSINIHPGYNPYNRGWYPQVFAIIGKTILGATIHIIDEKVDHGLIIDRKKVKIESWYTSKEAYEKVLDAEIELFRKNIRQIITNNFKTIEPEIEGEFHTRQEFKDFCELDLNEKTTLGDAIDKLRALTHGEYANAYFTDEDGKKIYVKVALNKE